MSPLQICDGKEDCLTEVDGLSPDEKGCSNNWVGRCIDTNSSKYSQLLYTCNLEDVAVLFSFISTPALAILPRHEDWSFIADGQK